VEKNFLETVSNEYPESFKEEKFVENKEKSKWPIVLGVATVILALIVILFCIFNKKIVMEDFISKSRETLNIWIKENGLNNKNILYTYEYSSIYDENIIINQSVDAGKKINKKKVLTFTVSKGADPDELVDFPDIKDMNYEEIKEWITKNKLTNVKITQENSDEINKDEVISYNLKNVSESEFTRSTNLSIVVSKGPKQKAQISMPNFVGKSYENIMIWADGQKIKITKTEIYSNKPVGEILSQSISEGQKVSEGDTVSVSVSKGPSVNIPYLIGQSKNYVDAWSLNNDIRVIYNESYSDSMDKNKVISQSIGAGSNVDEGETIIVTISLGKPYLSDYTGRNINELLEWVLEANENGCNINLVVNDKAYYSESVSKDSIINQDRSGFISTNDIINVTLSLGSKVIVDKNYIGLMEDDIKLFCSNLNCVYDYQKSDKPVGTIIDVKIGDKKLMENMYINSSDMILVTISEGA